MTIPSDSENGPPVSSITLAWGNHRLELGPRTLIMGILNVTPDSFSDGGHFDSLDKAVVQAEKQGGMGPAVHRLEIQQGIGAIGARNQSRGRKLRILARPRAEMQDPYVVEAGQRLLAQAHQQGIVVYGPWDGWAGNNKLRRYEIVWYTCDNRGWWEEKNLEVLSEAR